MDDRSGEGVEVRSQESVGGWWLLGRLSRVWVTHSSGV